MTKALLLLFIVFFSLLTSRVSALPASPAGERSVSVRSTMLLIYETMVLENISFVKKESKEIKPKFYHKQLTKNRKPTSKKINQTKSKPINYLIKLKK